MLYVLRQAVELAEAALEWDELLARIALEAYEEESGIELAGLRVHSVGKGVAAAQHLLTRVLTGEAYVGVQRDQGQAVRTLGFEVDSVVFVLFA